MLITESVVRSIGMMVLIFWVLSLIPEKPDSSIVLPIIFVILGIAGYAWMFSRQINKVKSAKHPIIRSVEALIVVATMFLAVFAATYVIISSQDATAFTEPLDHFSAYYFSLTVLATVGFGDITPVADSARIVCMVQMALDIVFIGVAVKILGGTAQNAMRARAVKSSSGTGGSERAGA
jgi:voltage-gated potassium channel